MVNNNHMYRIEKSKQWKKWNKTGYKNKVGIRRNCRDEENNYKNWVVSYYDRF